MPFIQSYAAAKLVEKVVGAFTDDEATIQSAKMKTGVAVGILTFDPIGIGMTAIDTTSSVIKEFRKPLRNLKKIVNRKGIRVQVLTGSFSVPLDGPNLYRRSIDTTLYLWSGTLLSFFTKGKSCSLHWVELWTEKDQ